MGPLAHVPAVVLARSNNVDFFPVALPDVTDPQFPGDLIKTQAPWVSEAPREYLGTRRTAITLHTHAVPFIAIAWRNAVRRAAVDINTNDRAMEILVVLAISKRIAGATPVAKACIQKPIGPEKNVTAIVIGLRLQHRQNFLFAAGKQRLSVVGAEKS